MMNKFWIPALIATAVFSSNAFADRHYDRDDHYQHRHYRQAKHVVVHHVYDEPQVVYQAPEVIYRERIVYQDRPDYYATAPRYNPPPTRHYERADIPVQAGSDRFVGQAIGAVAGGLIGNRVGKGNGRVAATAVGAVIGSMVGGNLASR